MSEENIGAAAEENPSETTHHNASREIYSNHHEPEDRIAEFSGNLLDRGDSVQLVLGSLLRLVSLK